MKLELGDVRELIKTVCVVGAGTMGRRIALQCAVHGFRVNLWSRTSKTLQEAMEWQKKALLKRVKKGMLSEGDVEKVLSRINCTTDLREAAGNADFVFEAASEDIGVKHKIFAQLDEICPSHTILSTNSSSIKSSLIADATKRPDKVLNVHFALRVEDNCLLEIMGNPWTSEETIELATALGQAMKMVVVRARKEVVGIILNRMLRGLLNAALELVEMGVATPEEVDKTWSVASGMMGPFALMDLIGLDVVLAVEKVWYQETGDPRDKPRKILVDKVERGELGVKTGKGFYIYSGK
ncbi:MAG: 3-hydroxyacyl-CoA dehydrogenase NAD-binding domain-containing protein [Candidatus Bathyarchaeia archaeon]